MDKTEVREGKWCLSMDKRSLSLEVTLFSIPDNAAATRCNR